MKTQENQLDILYYVREGLSHRAIARKLGCTPRTVKKYVEHPELIGKVRVTPAPLLASFAALKGKGCPNTHQPLPRKRFVGRTYSPVKLQRPGKSSGRARHNALVPCGKLGRNSVAV